jgi:hypothetical protein
MAPSKFRRGIKMNQGMRSCLMIPGAIIIFVTAVVIILNSTSQDIDVSKSELYKTSTRTREELRPEKVGLTKSQARRKIEASSLGDGVWGISDIGEVTIIKVYPDIDTNYCKYLLRSKSHGRWSTGTPYKSADRALDMARRGFGISQWRQWVNGRVVDS